MAPENTRRAKRTPLTQEEVAEIIALKKRQEHYRLHRFKKTRFYKIFNVFNIACIFVYLELIFCFYGPCIYRSYEAEKVQVNYGNYYNELGEPIVSDLVIEASNGTEYNLLIRDFIEVPRAGSLFYIGEDFLLRKELKGVFDDEKVYYRLFAASPALFLSVLVLFATFIAFLYNLNENAYSLSAVSVLNGLTIIGIVCL